MVGTLFQLHLLGIVFVEVGLAILCVWVQRKKWQLRCCTFCMGIEGVSLLQVKIKRREIWENIEKLKDQRDSVRRVARNQKVVCKRIEELI
jgi:hypothetical protein